MSFKVVRDSLGAVVAFGPNDDNYEPSQSYVIEETQPVIAPTPAEQIVAIETANPITHRNLRDLGMTVGQIAGAVTGTDPLQNPAVQVIVAIDGQIAPLRAQIS